MTAEDESPSSGHVGGHPAGPRKSPSCPEGCAVWRPLQGGGRRSVWEGASRRPDSGVRSVHPSPFMSSNMLSSYPGGLRAASDSFLGPVYFRHFAPVSLLPLPSLGTPPQGSRCAVRGGLRSGRGTDRRVWPETLALGPAALASPEAGAAGLGEQGTVERRLALVSPQCGCARMSAHRSRATAGALGVWNLNSGAWGRPLVWGGGTSSTWPPGATPPTSSSAAAQPGGGSLISRFPPPCPPAGLAQEDLPDPEPPASSDISLSRPHRPRKGDPLHLPSPARPCGEASRSFALLLWLKGVPSTPRVAGRASGPAGPKAGVPPPRPTSRSPSSPLPLNCPGPSGAASGSARWATTAEWNRPCHQISSGEAGVRMQPWGTGAGVCGLRVCTCVCVYAHNTGTLAGGRLSQSREREPREGRSCGGGGRPGWDPRGTACGPGVGGGHISPAGPRAPAWGRHCSSRRGQQGDPSPGLPHPATAFPAPNRSSCAGRARVGFRRDGTSPRPGFQRPRRPVAGATRCGGWVLLLGAVSWVARSLRPITQA